jgi:hypothetical protein
MTAVAPNEHSLGIAPSATFSTPGGGLDDEKESTRLLVDPDDPQYRSSGRRGNRGSIMNESFLGLW